MKLIKKKKAFTLTELLVVVVVLGALAAVAVPKMSQMLETRKTTEAENVFSAVRTEQEHRCVLGKSYQTVPAKMAMLNGVKNKNYKYELTSTGITAESQGAEYTLEMPSYKTGEICCRGDACRNLNKAYQDCETLAAVADECAGTPPPPPDPVPTCDNSHTEGPITTGECECGGSQTETWHCGADTSYNWQKTASTSCEECPKECGLKPVAEACPCGGTTEEWECNTETGEWDKTRERECNECACDDSEVEGSVELSCLEATEQELVVDDAGSASDFGSVALKSSSSKSKANDFDCLRKKRECHCLKSINGQFSWHCLEDKRGCIRPSNKTEACKDDPSIKNLKITYSCENGQWKEYRNDDDCPGNFKHIAKEESINVAKICGTQTWTAFCNGNSGYSKDPDFYIYAKSIAEPEIEFTSCGMCGGPGFPMPSYAGHVVKSPKVIGRYSAEVCPKNPQEMCDTCDPKWRKCNKSCIKNKANIEGCGRMGVLHQCFCPCDNGDGLRLPRSCEALTTSNNCSSERPYERYAREQREYAPLIGNAVGVYCEVERSVMLKENDWTNSTI